MDFKERITAELETPDSQPAPLTDATLPRELISSHSQ